MAFLSVCDNSMIIIIINNNNDNNNNNNNNNNKIIRKNDEVSCKVKHPMSPIRSFSSSGRAYNFSRLTMSVMKHLDCTLKIVRSKAMVLR